MSWLLISTIIGLAVNAFASIGSLVLNEIAWHDLEDYCKNRQKPKRFSDIFELRDQMEVGCGFLQLIGTVDSDIRHCVGFRITANQSLDSMGGYAKFGCAVSLSHLAILGRDFTTGLATGRRPTSVRRTILSRQRKRGTRRIRRRSIRRRNSIYGFRR